MYRPRVIPCLLLKETGLVKTVKFKNPKYIGDPINAVKLFNDKGVDELIILDINATIQGTGPQLRLIGQIASEAFMPVGYGGGIRSLQQVREILGLGVEKIIINSFAMEHPDFITAASDIAGSQSIVVSVDVKKNIWGKYEVLTHSATKKHPVDVVEYARSMEKYGAGELVINSVDRDGTMIGYDISIIKGVADAVHIPVVASGGAGHLGHLSEGVVQGKASAVAAGSMFVFHGKHRAVLITYPTEDELNGLFSE